MYVENIGKYSNEKMNKEVCRGIRVFQKKIKLFLKPGRLTYMILALKESMKFFWPNPQLQFFPLNLPG